MKRVAVCLGFIGGYILGARAGQRRYVQIKQAAVSAAESPYAAQAVDLAQQGLDRATDALAQVRKQAPEFAVAASEKFEQASEPVSEFVRTSLVQASEVTKSATETLAEAAREVGAAIANSAGSVKEQLTESGTRTRDRQAQELYSAAEQRDDVLADLDESDSDSMLDSERADVRNLTEDRKR